jgi:opacity protein-like surface antigen
MRKFHWIGCAALGAVLAAPTAVWAADLPPVVYEQPQPVFSGWYLRGDIGMTNQRVDKISTVDYQYNDFDVHDKDFDSGMLVGLGFGYEVNRWLRVDFTGEYRGKTEFHGYDTYPGGGSGAGAFPSGSNEYHAKKSEWLFLANAYADIGTWYGVTPFVGVGAGVVHIEISDFTDTNAPNNSSAYASDHGQWNPAFALHAGLGWQITPNLTMELAYRFLYLGDAKSGDIKKHDGTNDYDNPLKFKDITSHDVKLGMRYRFW